ncbi:MAG: hypothetical protein ACK4MV_01290 [Beijerinckiaceae bacterium]
MASILKFPGEARAPSTPAKKRGEPAQILFFTGVRYERAAAAEEKASRRPRRRRPHTRTKSA